MIPLINLTCLLEIRTYPKCGVRISVNQEDFLANLECLVNLERLANRRRNWVHVERKEIGDLSRTD